jgi:hypothetical protein
MFPQWQPISSAPKDGTQILIFEPAENIGGAVRHAGTVRIARWRSDTIPAGWSGSERSPTHWLPLPPHPNPSTRVT